MTWGLKPILIFKKHTKIRRLMSNEEKAKEVDKYLSLMLQKDQRDRRNARLQEDSLKRLLL